MVIRYYEGERVYFRPLEPSDEPLLREWINDPANWRTLDHLLPVNELREREVIEKRYKSASDIALGIVVRSGDRLIGVASLNRINGPNRSAVFGIVLGDRAHQSQGYGTEATRLMVRYGFRELNLNRIGLTVYADNERGIRAYRRAGFVQEGRLREVYFRNGSYHDELQFSLLRSEWEDDTDEAGVEVAAEEDDLPVVPLGSMTMWDTSAPV
jgi:RimJ/RimL family protein N-acetyltransferase